MSVSGDFGELAKWQKAFAKAASSATKAEINRSLAQSAIELSRKEVPRQTGALQASIRVVFSSSQGFVIGSSLPYANYVLNGTSKMTAKPFFPKNGLPAKWQSSFDSSTINYLESIFA